MNLFTEDERTRIAEDISKVEAQTAGEIVPYVVMQSDAYPIARWRGAAVAILLGLAIASALSVTGVPADTDIWHGRVLLPALFGLAAIGAVVGGPLPPLVRALTGTNALEQAAHRRAMQAFVDEEVFATRDRTGILMFVSLLEHRIEVIADAGISRKVDPDAWSDIAAAIREGMTAESLAQGFLNGLQRCQEILDEAGIERRVDDTDELPNTIREERS